MSRNLLPLALATLTAAAGTAQAEVPSVAVDIAPVHSLVARVMEGLGEPDLVIPPGASPHGYSMRPSEAQALQDADVIFWIGPELAPWLDGSIATLAPDAAAVALLEASGTTELDLREGALFEADDHEGEDGHAGETQAGSDQADHAETAETATDHGVEEDHAEETAGADEHAGHEGGGHDPHAWLSPMNAKVWLDAIAAELSTVDPENAVIYAVNAADGKAEMDALITEINGILAPVRDRNFIVFHDAYQYFEASFDFPASGAISLGDATKPSPARVAEIRGRVAEAGVTCVLGEPQFNPDLVRTVLDGTEARSGVLDPLGSDLEPGPALYPTLLRNLARTLADCL